MTNLQIPDQKIDRQVLVRKTSRSIPDKTAHMSFVSLVSLIPATVPRYLSPAAAHTENHILHCRQTTPVDHPIRRRQAAAAVVHTDYHSLYHYY